MLRKRVVERLEELKLSRRGSIEIWVKAIFLLVGFWYSLFQMYTSTDNFLTACGWSMVMGVFAAFVGTCIQHDGNHGAFAKSCWVNKIAGWTLDMIGASAYTWEFQHMLGHHPYTNVLDMDESDKKQKGIDCDIVEKDQESDPDVFSSYPAMRMHPAHEPSWFHKYQHIYAPFLFSFMTLSKVMQQDIEVVLNKRLCHIDAKCRYGNIWNVARFWGMKMISMVYTVGLLCYFHGVRNGLILFVIGHLTCGEVLATMFIVNHVIEGVAFAQKDGSDANIAPTTAQGVNPMRKMQENIAKDKRIPLNDWAAVQVRFVQQELLRSELLLNSTIRIDLTNSYLRLQSQSVKQALTGAQDLGFGIISVVDFRTKLNTICFQVCTSDT